MPVRLLRVWWGSSVGEHVWACLWPTLVFSIVTLVVFALRKETRSQEDMVTAPCEHYGSYKRDDVPMRCLRFYEGIDR